MSKRDLMNGLFNAYNQKPTPERARAYEKWSSLNDEEIIEAVIDFVVGEDARLPPVSRLWALSRDQFARRAQDVPEEPCGICDGVGLVPGIWKDKQGMWSHGIISACKCSNGKRKHSKLIPANIFDHDPRYLDLIKVLKKHKEKAITPWGAIPYFYQELRIAGITARGDGNQELNKTIQDVMG